MSYKDEVLIDTPTITPLHWILFNNWIKAEEKCLRLISQCMKPEWVSEITGVSESMSALVIGMAPAQYQETGNTESEIQIAIEYEQQMFWQLSGFFKKHCFGRKIDTLEFNQTHPIVLLHKIAEATWLEVSAPKPQRAGVA